MKAFLLFLMSVVLAGCENQKRAHSPLQETRTAVHVKSENFDVPPKILSGYRPAYPRTEALRGEPGFVVIICTIGIDGRPRDFEVEEMSNIAFAQEAARAIMKWKWSPALKNGRPVPQKVRVPMTFQS